MNSSINSIDFQEALAENNDLNQISENIWDKVNFLTQKLLDLKISKEKFNKYLLIILWSSIFAQPVLAWDISLKFWGQSLQEGQWLELCYSTQSDQSEASEWTCQPIATNTIPPYCYDDPDTKNTYYEWTLYWVPEWKIYVSGRYTLKNWWKGDIWAVLELNNDAPYTRMMYDYDNDWKKDLLEYKDWQLYIKYGKEGFWCISQWEWDRNKIIENYSSWNRKIVERNMLDDEKSDIALYDDATWTCDIDLSNNWYWTIDLANQPCDLPNMDTMFYNSLTWKTYLGLINQEWTWYTFNSFTWNDSQEIVSINNWDDKDKVLAYKKTTGKAYLCTLNQDWNWFNNKSLNWNPWLDIIKIWDLLWDWRWTVLARSTIWWKSYICRLNENWDNFDVSEITIEEWEEIIAGHFNSDKRKDIVRYNKETWKIKLMITNPDGKTFIEKDLEIEPWLDIITANLRWAGIDDIISFNKETWNWNINRLKTDEKTFHKYPFWPWKKWMDMYKWDFAKNWIDTLFMYDKNERETWTWQSNTYLISVNWNWTWFEGPYVNRKWHSWFDMSVWDIDWSWWDWIIAYKPETWLTYLIKVDKDDSWNWIFNMKKLSLKWSFDVITWEFDDK